MTTDAGTPTPWPIEDVVARDLSGWARSLYNCTTGDNHLRTSEYYQLIRDLDAYEIVIAAAREQIAALTAAESERDALRAKADHWHECFTVLERAIVGDTGASAITEAKRLRARVAGLEAGLREALEAGTKLLGEKDALRARVKSLETGLHFYANTSAYLEQRGSKDDPDDCSVPIEEDGGRIARALLAPSSEVTNGN